MGKQNPSFCCILETHLNIKDRHYIRGKGWEKIFQANGPKKRAGVVLLISDKIDFKPKLIRREREGHYILIKGKSHQENIAIINIYAPNTRAPTSIKERLYLKSHIDPHTLRVGNFNILLLQVDRSSRQKLNREMPELMDTINQMNLTDIYRTFHPHTNKHVFFFASQFL